MYKKIIILSIFMSCLFIGCQMPSSTEEEATTEQTSEQLEATKQADDTVATSTPDVEGSEEETTTSTTTTIEKTNTAVATDQADIPTKKKNTGPKLNFIEEHLEESTDAYMVKASFPFLKDYSDAKFQMDLNKTMGFLVNKEIIEFKEAAMEEENANGAWELSIDSKVHCKENGLISVSFESYKDFRGVHPNFEIKAFNYDLKNDKVLKITDLFTGDYKKALLPLLQKNMKEDYYKGQQGCDIAEYDVAFETFNMSPTELVFSFPELPHVCGHPIGKLPYSKIPTEIIKKEGIISRML